jgi:hypothetical protein
VRTDGLEDALDARRLGVRDAKVRSVFTSAVFCESTVKTSSSTGGYLGESTGRP